MKFALYREEVHFGEIGSIGRLVSMKTEPEMGRPLIIVKKKSQD